jgi:FkbM family methyltransferase
MRLTSRAASAVSRRLGRPELLAAVNVHARRAQRDEIGVRAVLAGTLRNGSIYVDIGANRGQILAEAVRVSPQGRHIAFEPVPGLAREVARAFPQVDCRCKALGARADRASFCHFKRIDGWSGLRRQPEISDERGEPEFITVEVSTLDDELAGVSPSVIKIDVEGGELGVLEGGRTTLSQARPVVIFEHVPRTSALYGALPGAPWDLLREVGYEVFTVTGFGPFSRSAFVESSDVVNWLATPVGPVGEGMKQMFS